MQLKIQRSQRMGGFTGSTVLFCLDVRADYAPHEAASIAKYKLGKEVIYNSAAAKRHLDSASGQLDRTQSGGAGEFATGLARGAFSLALAKMNLNITMASLGRGHHIECKDLPELMEAEEAVMQACRNVRDYLALAATFNGSTILVDFSQRDEQVHTAMGSDVYAPLPSSVSRDATRAVDAEFEEAPFAPDAGPLTPSDIAQMQFGNMEQATAEFERKMRALVSEHREILLAGVAAVAGIFILVRYGFGAFTLFAVAVTFGAMIWLNNRRR
jgi:hypothetical protein